MRSPAQPDLFLTPRSPFFLTHAVCTDRAARSPNPPKRGGGSGARARKCDGDVVVVLFWNVGSPRAMEESWNALRDGAVLLRHPGSDLSTAARARDMTRRCPDSGCRCRRTVGENKRERASGEERIVLGGKQCRTFYNRVRVGWEKTGSGRKKKTGSSAAHSIRHL